MFEKIKTRIRQERQLVESNIYVGGQCCYPEGDTVLLTIENNLGHWELSIPKHIALEIGKHLIERSHDGESTVLGEPDWRKALGNL